MKKYSLKSLATLLIVFVILVSGNLNPANAESKGDMESLVKQSIMVWNTGNTAIAEQLYTKDITVHLVDQQPPELKGVKAIMDYFSFLRTAYPDMKYEPDHMTVDGDRVITEMTFTGTNTGPRGDLPPTNKKVKISSVLISQITDGEISEEWVYTNKASIYRQLGLTSIPSSDSE